MPYPTKSYENVHIHLVTDVFNSQEKVNITETLLTRKDARSRPTTNGQ